MTRMKAKKSTARSRYDGPLFGDDGPENRISRMMRAPHTLEIAIRYSWVNCMMEAICNDTY